MTMEDVRQLEAIMRDPSVSSSSTAKQVVEEIAEEVNEPEAFHSNVAMKGRTGAACEVAEAKLQQALLDLQLLLSEQENEALERLSSTGASIAALWKTAPSSNMKEEHMRRWR
ncbi:MAG: hypothetical protein QHC40_13510 [Sphingobium sp.]|nr:hypothetical protein [Sphingobium sp.]